jgi:hypothetical protein
LLGGVEGAPVLLAAGAQIEAPDEVNLGNIINVISAVLFFRMDPLLSTVLVRADIIEKWN